MMSVSNIPARGYVGAQALTLLFFFSLMLSIASAQCPEQFSTGLTSNNSSSFGTTVEIKAERSLTLCRIYASGNSTTAHSSSVTVWAHPGGLPWAKTSNPAGVNDNQWFCVGTVTVNFPGDRTPTGFTEVPVDLSVLGVMSPGDKWGILLQSNGIGYKTGAAPYIMTNGDITLDTETWGPTGSATCPSTTSFTFSNFPRQFCGKITYALITSPNDAGIASIDSPLTFCAGTHPITLTLKNNGTNQLTSATINWTLNGVPQPSYSWTGLLDTLDQATRSTQITLGTHTFLDGISYTIQAWTTNPNGAIDTVTNNDTCTVTRKAALTGTYTVGGTLPDYPTLTSAVDDLNANGICGPVVFKIRTGTYNEQISISAISGTSATNTIIFESETGNNTDVTLRYNAPDQGHNHIVQLSGSDYVTFRNMSMTTLNGTYATAVCLQGGAENCTLENLILTGSTSATTSNYAAVVYSPSGSLDHNFTIRGCTILNGAYGIYMYGSGTAALERNLLIENNTISNFAYMGIYAYYEDSPQYLHNDIRTTNVTYTYKYPSYMYYNYNAMRYVGNTIYIGGNNRSYGILAYYSTGTSSNYAVIANNFMTVNNGSTYYGYGMRVGYGSYTRVMNNTVYINSLSTYYALYVYSGSTYYLSNNILVYNGPGYALYTNSTSNISYSDDNVLSSATGNLAYWGGARADLTALQAASGKDGNSIEKIPDFADVSSGDLHLVGASEDDPKLIGTFEKDVTDDIDGEPRMLPYRGADEACYITKGSVWYELTDANGVQSPYANVPGSMGVHYHVEFPEYDATVTITVRFYSITNNALMYTTSFQATKDYGVTLDGLQVLALSGIPVGVYRVEATFNTKNSCDGYRDYIPSQEAFMLLKPGETPCLVWPGDVNNDGLVNYGDRTSLNTYIHDANLSSMWLTGPARYRADATENPLTYLEWEAQAAVPWETAEGCYMDADGNGTVNSFDYIPIKLNWMRDHGVAGPKSGDSFNPETFDMSQNFPNPFNPTTQIQYSVPELSDVRITVVDQLGRTVTTLVNDVMAAGVHTVQFDGSTLTSGTYIVTATMAGTQSGITFTKTIRITLAK